MMLTLRQARALKGLTQEQVANSTGLDIMTISRIERGRDPRFSTLKKLCDFYGLSMSDIIMIEKPISIQPDMEATEELTF